MPDCSTRSKVTRPTKASVGSRMSHADIGGGGDQPEPTRPPETAPRNMVARPVASAIVDYRAPCRVKCSVVTNVTAAGRGSMSAASADVDQGGRVAVNRCLLAFTAALFVDSWSGHALCAIARSV